jgi:predicted nucleic acid-binding Zn ribbon protein
MKTGGLPDEAIVDMAGTFLSGVKIPKGARGGDAPVDQTEGESSRPLVEERMTSALEDAATLILSQLTPSIREYAMEIADIVLKVPRWQLVLGCVLAQQESGTLANPSIDPGWRQVEISLGTGTCKECGQPFPPKRMGQRFCSNKCGSAAQKKQIEIDREKKKREDEMRRVPHKISQRDHRQQRGA